MAATPETQTVLVVDDEAMIREVLTQYLEHDGFSVIESADGEDAIKRIHETSPDLVLLDLMLPKKNGLDVLRHVRSSSSVPIIILTAHGDEDDRVAGLELGADDYVVKPFSPREVAARVRSVLRRPRGEDIDPVFTFSDVAINLGGRTVSKAGEEIDLTRKEFDLLAFFINQPDIALTREQLLSDVWASSEEWQDPSTVTVHISRLRQKLEPDPSAPIHFVTVYGVGYRFVTDASSQ